MKLKILSHAKCDNITEQFTEFRDYHQKLNLGEFQSFTGEAKGLDDFIQYSVISYFESRFGIIIKHWLKLLS